MKFVWIALGVAVLVLLAGAAWRFFTIRNHGTQVLMRALPATGTHGWRHGVLRYSGDSVRFYKLRSFSFAADEVHSRNDIAVTGRRQATETEQEFMPGVEVVVLFSAAGKDYEFATDHRAAMALISWIESSPDKRQVRTDMNQLHQRAFGA